MGTNENQSNSIKSLREDERPRERLIKNGATTLSDSELLAIIIRAGSKGYSAIDIARDMLKQYENLSNLTNYDFSVFKKFKGIGPTKAVTLAAVFEISRRAKPKSFDSRMKITGPKVIAEYYKPKMMGEKKEKFFVLLLNSSNIVFREILVSEGILNYSVIHPREVFKIAISESAASVILLHNHPSGNPEPSKDDINSTKQLIQAGEILDIKVLDHLIIAGDEYRSFSEMGLI